MKNIWALLSALFFAVFAFSSPLDLPARSRRGGACDHIAPFPGHPLACNGIDQGKAAESLENETLRYLLVLDR